jgi:N-methylhydantoinase B
MERDIEAVRQDVINGYVSVEHARQDYGVVIDLKSFEVDDRATQKLRSNLLTQKSAD